MRRALPATLVAAMLLLAAAPAWAHEEIEPKTLPTGTPTFFTLSAANEKKVDLVKLVVTAPKGVPFGEATRSPAGWTVDKTDTAITWTGGAMKPEAFDQWGFETDGADQPGTFTFTVTLGFADGSSEPLKVPVTVTAGSAGAASSGGTAGSKKSGTHNRRANAALGLGGVAVVLSLAAIALAARRWPTPPTGKTADW